MFSRNLKDAMWVRNVSTDDLMEQLMVPRAVISSYRTRRKYPKWYRAIGLADCLDVSLDWLTDRDYHNTQDPENTPLSEIITELMELSEISKRDTYRAVNMGSSTLNKILNDENVELGSVIKLADFFDVSLDYLAGRGPQKFITDKEFSERESYD